MKCINLIEDEILQIIEECDRHLKKQPKIKFSFDRKWSDNFSPKAGIYAIFYEDQLLYIGETANLKERMKEVKRTLNHTIRKKLCKHLSLNSVMEKDLFLIPFTNNC